eukprot:203929_1
MISTRLIVTVWRVLMIQIILSLLCNAGCLPSKQCQNSLTTSGYTASGQYVCNADGSKSQMAYEDHDCTSTEAYSVFTYTADDTSSTSFYNDVVCDGSCTKYIKYREYAITDSTDTTCSTKYSYFTRVVKAGCDGFGDANPNLSIKWSCTDNSLIYTTYGNGDCSGEGFELVYKAGCDNSLGYPTYNEIEYCGSGINRLSTMIAFIISSVVILFH